MMYHSHYVAICLRGDQRMPAQELISMGRLGSNVRKTVLLCSLSSVYETSESESRLASSKDDSAYHECLNFPTTSSALDVDICSNKSGSVDENVTETEGEKPFAISESDVTPLVDKSDAEAGKITEESTTRPKVEYLTLQWTGMS